MITPATRIPLFALCYLAVAIIAPAQATDSFHYCEQAVDQLAYDQGENGMALFDGDRSIPIRSINEIMLKESHGFCVADDQRSYLWRYREYVAQVVATIDGDERQLQFLCYENSSGLPAGVQNCEAHTTRDAVLVPAYADKIADGNAAVLDADIQATYATSTAACSAANSERIRLSSNRIHGDDFDCLVSALQPAGTGLVSMTGKCSVDGQLHDDHLALDLGNFDDHFALALPGRDDWINLYRCAN